MVKRSGKSRGSDAPDADRAARQHQASCLCANCETLRGIADSNWRQRNEWRDRALTAEARAFAPPPIHIRDLPPIPMLLWCPECGKRHVDVGDFATLKHHTHACQKCGHVWRPALVNTIGVRFLPGFKNEAGR